MKTFFSGFAEELEKFVQYRIASGSWNEYASHQNLVYFDHFCVNNYGGAPALTQGSSLIIFPVGTVLQLNPQRLRSPIKENISRMLFPKKSFQASLMPVTTSFLIKTDRLLYLERYSARHFSGFCTAVGSEQQKQDI